MNYLFVFLGGGLGSICRFGIAQWIANYKFQFPWATITANVLACLVLGILVGLNLKGKISSPMGFFLMVGFCGGFSTFSTFTNETFQLMATAEWGKAFANIFISLAVCLLSFSESNWRGRDLIFSKDFSSLLL
ncbi:MAG: fluoride efflux transporter CrcB [Saprospiraceae bacterium]